MPDLPSPSSSSGGISPVKHGLRPLLREGPENRSLPPITSLGDLTLTSAEAGGSRDGLTVTGGGEVQLSTTDKNSPIDSETAAAEAGGVTTAPVVTRSGSRHRKRSLWNPARWFRGWGSWAREGDGLVGVKRSRSRGLEGQRSGRSDTGLFEEGDENGGKEGDKQERVVVIGDPDKTAGLSDCSGNTVKTSKYTFVTFLPRNLFEQFHRIAYVYFLIIAVLNQVPVLAVFGRTASLFPLLAVLIVTAIKDAYEDWARHRADKEENNRICPAERNGKFEPIKWRHIRVGDVLKVCSGEAIPCDMVLLSCSDPSGRAYIETMNLDGETTLKSRTALLSSSQSPKPLNAETNEVRGTIHCEAPNRNIYSFTGKVDLEDKKSGGKKQKMAVGLGPPNMLLRGSELKNTAWVLGCVVYAGKETKAQLNNSGAQSKRSRLEHYMNRDVLILAGILLVLCLVGAIGMGVWIATNDVKNLPYYGERDDFHGTVGEAALNWFSCLIVFQIMVPISLYISMELVRLGQSYFMTRDLTMYHEPSDTPLKVSALNINEDLGQVRYVFSDKTGTLTENKMEFRACTIWGTDFGNLEVQTKQEGEEASYAPREIDENTSSILEGFPVLWRPKAGSYADPSLVRSIQRPSSAEQQTAIHDFLLTLAICNTVVPSKISHSAGQRNPHLAELNVTHSGEQNESKVGPVPQNASTGAAVPQSGSEVETNSVPSNFAGGSATGGDSVMPDESRLAQREGEFVEYQAESPDEQALVTAAATYGFCLLERNPDGLVVSVLDEIQRYEILGIHEFDSMRKRMSVVVKCPNGQHKLLVKGADSVMFGMVNEVIEDSSKDPVTFYSAELGQSTEADSVTLHSTEREQLRTVYDGTVRDLDAYAREGLRTLVVAARDLDETEVATWQKRYHAASVALQDRAAKLSETAMTIERELVLLGGTGIEDKLQTGVPDTIATLRKAGMHVWVLTGDKQETAVSIAFACQLITRNMQQIVINESTMEGTRKAIADAKSQYHHRFRSAKQNLRGNGFLDGILNGNSPRWNGMQIDDRRRDETGSSSVWGQVQIFFGAARGRENFPGTEATIASADSNPQSPTSWPATPGCVGSRQQSGSALAFEGLPKMESPDSRAELALVIDGNSLFHALEPGVDDLLYEVASICQVVVCCRVAPLQKAGVVALVKRRSNHLTLAIGDGANDVSMIQMADVGVGISGQEGRQAVMAADFAIAQFRYLQRLMLVHGHWNYQRLAYMVLYNFYKNAVFVMMLFWFILYTAYSPQTGISDWSLVFYSLIFTSVPTIAVGIMEKDLKAETLLKLPGLYAGGPRNETYNGKLFWVMFLDTVWQSLVLFYVPYFSAHNNETTLWGIGQIWTFAVVLLANFHLAMDVRHWTIFHHLAIWLSIVVSYIILIIIDLLPLLPQFGSLRNTANKAEYWLDLLLITAVALIPRFVVKYVAQQYWPTDTQIALEAEKCGRLQGRSVRNHSEMENILASPRRGF